MGITPTKLVDYLLQLTPIIVPLKCEFKHLSMLIAQHKTYHIIY